MDSFPCPSIPVDYSNKFLDKKGEIMYGVQFCSILRYIGKSKKAGKWAANTAPRLRGALCHTS